MRYYTIRKDGKGYVAISPDGKKGYILKNYITMNNLIIRGHGGHIPGLAEVVDLKEVGILSPIPHPRQDILCMGMNYADHAGEAAKFSGEAFKTDNDKPVFFSKRAASTTGTGDIIPAHEELTDSLDYECELAVVIGRDAYRVKEADAYDYIFGYTIINDVSARNLQTGHKQWYFGKSLDGFCPMGPCIVSKDEFEFPPRLDIKCRVNGELRQDSNTGNLITGIGRIIEVLSAGMTLTAGTIIATGTPAGVAMGMEKPAFLKKGDKVECEIEGIGILKNTVG